jgi:hypothetical protein
VVPHSAGSSYYQRFLGDISGILVPRRGLLTRDFIMQL